MSQEAVARFLELVASDRSTESAMNSAAEQRKDVAATAVGLGGKRSFAFTVDEFASAIQSFHREHPGALDDAELKGVSGGLNPQPDPPLLVSMSPIPPWFSQPWASREWWTLPRGGAR